MGCSMETKITGHRLRYAHGLAVSVATTPILAVIMALYIVYLVAKVASLLVYTGVILLWRVIYKVYHSPLAPSAKPGETLSNPILKATNAIVTYIKETR